MAEIINTVDKIGDDALIDQIIMRTITEYHDTGVRKIGTYAFHSCSNLNSVYIPFVTEFSGERHFQGCTALTKIDLPSLTSIGNIAFFGCSALTTVILRNTSGVCGIVNNTPFSRTPIESGTGYIYVPRALVDSYKAANIWKNHANQFRALEDYTVDGTTTGELDSTKI